ncbi:unnamed protein product [Mytilus edulis]|uniref:Uncharacterized protein n=1 Tax=Mytilus edulis TaxID=6550 RepID=A0A8S3QE24_MYTED|nr:unnamed protein product [Mytilus edulis]
MVKDSKASKDLWKCIHSLNPSQQEKPYELLNEDGVKTNNVSDICNVFNKFFTSCVENLTTNRCMSKTHDYAKLNQFVQKKFTKSEQVKFSIPPVTINGLFNEMIKLDINKSTGSDNIGPTFFKLSAPFITSSLTYIFNRIIDTSTLPSVLKNARCKRKPYWSEELQDSWNKTCDAERQWKRCKSIGKPKLRNRFIQSRKDFDKLNRKAKRNYQLEQQK